MNTRAVATIYRNEMLRFFRTLTQSFLSPVVSTSLYFVVFGAAIGNQMEAMQGTDYGAFIVPGLVMLSVMTQSISAASFGIYFPKFIRTTYELLSAPVSVFEIVLGFISASVTKALIVGSFILLLAKLIVDYRIEYPLYMLIFLLLTSVCFALMGFIIGVWAENFEQLQVIPLMLVTPLVILGGSFYSLSVLPPFWQTVTLFNPVVYLISGFRWTFFGQADVPVIFSLIAFGIIGASCLAVIWWIFHTGWRLKA